MKRLTFLMFVCICMAGMAFGQTIEPTMYPTKASQSEQVIATASQTKGKISLPQSSPYSVAPGKMFEWVKANGFHPMTINKRSPKRIAASEYFANDPYIYTVFSSSYQTVNEGYEQGQVLGLYLNDKSALYKEMDGKTLPSADYGSRNGYVRVGNKWYTLSSQKITVTDAVTGVMEREITTDVAWAARGASYDYNRKKFYVINFDGLIEIDGESFESTNLGALSGGFVTCIAAAPDGNIYYVTYAGQLYKYDYSTKECSQVLSSVKLKDADGNTINWQNQGMAAAFDWTTGLMYFTYLDNNWTDYLVCVDITGANEPYAAYTFPGRELTMMGIYIPYAEDGAPAPATAINYDGNTLSFMVPTTTVGGDDLTGSLTAFITVNGEETEYNVTPGQVFSLDLSLTGNVAIAIEIGNAAGRSAERRVMTYVAQMSAFFANDPYIYTVFSSSYQTVNEGYEQGQVLGLYLNDKSALYKEMDGKTLPSADYGSRNGYVRVGNKWYTLSSQKITVTDAVTGVMEREITTDVAWAARGASYDYNRKKFYVINFDGLIEIDGESFESTNLGALSGGFVTCIAAAPDGNIYYVTYAGQLYKYDYSTKECSQVLSSVKLKDADGNTINWQNQGMAAAFDWTTGLMYFTYLDNNWTDYLVCVDITGANEPYAAYTFPGRELTMMGIYIPYAEDGAPAPATAINYDGNTLSFMVPTTTVGGDDLTGSLTAFITVNGEETEYNVTPGQVFSLPLSLTGNVVIAIEIGNATGRSAERRINTFIGTDLPTHVTNLVLNADDGENFSLSWDAPTSSQNGGQIDDAALNYTVTRMPDNIVVAEGLKVTTFTEPIPARRDRYYYIVDVYANTTFGDSYASNVVSGGTEYVVPFCESFYEQADFDIWTVVDSNEDGQTWGFMLPWGETSGYAYLHGNGVTNSMTGFVSTLDDDWLISLPISLKSGVDYRLSYDISMLTLGSEKLEVKLGRGKVVTGTETTLTEEFTVVEGSQSQIFNVDEDGIYTIMFHATTVGNSVSYALDNIAVDVYAAFDGPGAVTDATVQAGAEGAMTNTLSFKAPTVNYKGGSLQGLERIEVYRNDEKQPATVFENPVMGETYTWVDEDLQGGTVTYRILPWNEAGQGEEVILSNWVGLDVPANVANVRFFMNDNFKAAASWDAVGSVGAHGGYVNPQEVTYTLHRYDEWNWSNHWPAVTAPSSATSAVDTDFEVSYGQQYVTYLVVASNAAGASSGTEFSIVLGQPYETPYTESFPSALAQQEPWTLLAESYYYAWRMVDGSGLSVKPYDGDNGMLRFQYISDESNRQMMTGPRVSLKDLETPELSFYMYHGFETEPGELTLHVYTNTDDEGWEKADDVEYNNGGDGWCRYALPLRADADNVQIAFAATALDASAAIFLDNIKIDEQVDNDAAIAFFGGEKRVEAGEEVSITVSIANYGAEELRGYSVTVTADGETLEPFGADELPAIAPNNVESFTFDYATDRRNPSRYIELKVEVTAEGDEVADNNSRDFKLFVHNTNLPEPEQLQGVTYADGNTTIIWQKPSKEEIQDDVTDGFDEYDSFVIEDFGDWLTYDGDGLVTAYFGGPEIPHCFEEKAWQVWDPVEAGFSLETFDVLTPVSGTKYLTSWAASDGISQTLPQDDWLISSDILGGSDLSFWYRVPNDGTDAQVFEIMYSTTDQDVESFMVLDRDSVVGTTDWVQFLYTLPDDAKYFAIRNCSYGSYLVAFLDDIQYTPLYSSTTPLTLTGYKVYRNDEVVAELNNSQTSYEEKTDGDIYTYNVTAVYTVGESRYSNDYVSNISTTGIFEKDGKRATISTADGAIRISNASGRVSVYSLNGKRIFDGSTRATLTVRVAPGVYVVNAGGRVQKVTVR